jgi:hypothetical protein
VRGVFLFWQVQTDQVVDSLMQGEIEGTGGVILPSFTKLLALAEADAAAGEARGDLPPVPRLHSC